MYHTLKNTIHENILNPWKTNNWKKIKITRKKVAIRKDDFCEKERKAMKTLIPSSAYNARKWLKEYI